LEGYDEAGIKVLARLVTPTKFDSKWGLLYFELVVSLLQALRISDKLIRSPTMSVSADVEIMPLRRSLWGIVSVDLDVPATDGVNCIDADQFTRILREHF